MNKDLFEIGTTNESWPFTSLAVRYNGRCFIITAICVPDNPRKIDVFYTEVVYENGSWQNYDKDLMNDNDKEYLSNVLHDYLYNDNKPMYFGVDFIERDLIT